MDSEVQLLTSGFGPPAKRFTGMFPKVFPVTVYAVYGLCRERLVTDY